MLTYDRDETPMPSPGVRLLPWTTEAGNPCYLKGGSGTPMAIYADEVEEAHLVSGGEALKRAVRTLDMDGARRSDTEQALRAVAAALSNVLRVADSRGARLPDREDVEISGAAAQGNGEWESPWHSAETFGW